MSVSRPEFLSATLQLTCRHKGMLTAGATSTAQYTRPLPSRAVGSGVRALILLSRQYIGSRCPSSIGGSPCAHSTRIFHVFSQHFTVSLFTPTKFPALLSNNSITCPGSDALASHGSPSRSLPASSLLANWSSLVS